MKNVLVLIHDDDGQEARLQGALDITRAIEGHLICLDVVKLPVVADVYFEECFTALLDDAKAREARNRERLEARLVHEDVQWEFRTVVDQVPDALVAGARMADVIVVNRRLDDVLNPDLRPLASKLVIRSGKPIVAMPRACSGFNAGGRATVAWDGSLPAMAAMSAAVPLLRIASDVQLLEVGADTSGDPIEDAALYLSRHGIHAGICRVEGKAEPSSLILQALTDNHSSYCVMGAFGHSRLRETLFGGVTWNLLSTIEIPLFIAH